MTTEYMFVGGSKDGVRMTLAEPASILRVPVPQAIEVVRKVIPFRESLTDHIEEYRRYGHVYWWDGLIDDATAAIDVSDEVIARGGSALRALIRKQLRRHLEDLAPGKGLHRIVWRVKPGDRYFTHRVMALVGPRAVERGLFERTERRALRQP